MMADKVMIKGSIKRLIKSKLSMILICLGFTLGGLYVIFFVENITYMGMTSNGTFWGWASVIFFGGGGLLYLSLDGLFRPFLAQIDTNAVTQFLPFGKKEIITWGNIFHQEILQGESPRKIVILSRDGRTIEIHTTKAKLSDKEIWRILIDFKKRHDSGKLTHSRSKKN